jgi:DNA primase
VSQGLCARAKLTGRRGGRARHDYTQNAINKTLVAPYSPRPGAGAPVSAPIHWDELDDPTLRPDAYTIRTIGDRIPERGDPFADLSVTPSRHRRCASGPRPAGSRPETAPSCRRPRPP